MHNEIDPDQSAAQDLAIASAIERDRSRLWRFIRRRVHDQLDAEDILQDVFYELVVAYRLMKPIEEAGASVDGGLKRSGVDDDGSSRRDDGGLFHEAWCGRVAASPYRKRPPGPRRGDRP